MGSKVLAIAHRGASAELPENTLAAFDEALRQGADGIELDLQLSRDGVPFVHHDDRLPAGPRLSDLDAASVRRLPPALDTLRGRGHIPTLEEVLAEIGGKTLLQLEIKALEGSARNAQLASAVVDLVRRAGAEPDVMILSFDLGVLDTCRTAAPEIRRVWNLDRRPGLGRRLTATLPSLAAVGADVRRLSSRLASTVREAGRELLVYTCNTEPQVDLALDRGATYVLSDRPAWLCDRLVARRVRRET